MSHMSMRLPLEAVYLSAGSNLGDRRQHLQNGLDSLSARGVEIRRVSSRFETEPVGPVRQPWFLNLAMEVTTDRSPEELLSLCKEIERMEGRIRARSGEPRSLDLDILLFGSRIVVTKDLVIPHPRMSERKFVLEPLAQIAPEAQHPLLGQSIRTLLASCRDPSVVRIDPTP